MVKVKELQPVRDAVRKYLTDNAGWRAEDRDLVWSHRYVVARLALLAGETMSFADLCTQVEAALAEASAPIIKRLTPSLIAEKIADALPGQELSPEEKEAALNELNADESFQETSSPIESKAAPAELESPEIVQETADEPTPEPAEPKEEGPKD